MMAQVYLIAAPGDKDAGDALAEWLKLRGFVVRTDYGSFQYPPLRGNEVLVMLWSRTALMSVKQMFLINRAIDAWEAGRLVAVKLDHGLKPRGLGDVDMVDLAFAPAREHRYMDVAKAVREIASPPAPPMAPAPFPAPGGAAPLGSRASSDAASSRDFGKDVIPMPVAGKATTPDLFVSYAHADKETVLPIVDRVEGMGVDVWIDREDIKVGQGWAGAIVRAIKTVSRVCLMCSEKAFQSDHVRREIYLADKYGKALVPVRLDNAEMPEDIEYFLIDKQWLDAAVIAGPDGEATLREVFAA